MTATVREHLSLGEEKKQHKNSGRSGCGKI